MEPSYISLMNKYCRELNLVKTADCQYGIDGKFSASRVGPALPKAKILQMIYSGLDKAPVYCIDRNLCDKFIEHIDEFAASNDKKESCELKKMSQKIHLLVQKKAQKIISCSTGPHAKELNQILDKAPSKLSQKDCDLLLDFANALGSTRFSDHCFYHKISILQSTQKLLKHCPSILILELENATYPIIIYDHPETSEDCMLALNLELSYARNTDLAKVNPELIQAMIKRKLETPDIKFKDHLQQRLTLHILYDLAAQWDALEANISLNQTLIKSPQNGKTSLKRLDCFTKEFIHQPPAYIEIKDNLLELNPFSSPDNLSPIARDLKVYCNVTNTELDRWYQAIYRKLQQYKKDHPTCSLPLLSPEQYSQYQNFIEPNEIEIPLRDQFAEWEKEIVSELAKNQKPKSARKSKKPQSTNKPKGKPTRKFKVEYIDEEESKDLPLESPVSVPLPTFESIKPTYIDEVPPESIHELLSLSSPFVVRERVTDWFNPTKENLNILNIESTIVHNFAWAAQIAWEVGLRYYRLNERGQYQPAIALLCDLECSLFPKAELFLITMTFDHIVEEENLKNFDFDPKWECYHRSLTRRDQMNETVEEYIKIAKDRFIDFPALPTQAKQFEIALSDVKKVYPDRSFIESTNGGVITIRDPKYDTKSKVCRLRLFGIQKFGEEA